jgi:hypothetical protein
MKTGLLHSLLEIAHLFVSVDNLALPQFWVCALTSFLQLVDLRDDIRFQRSSVSLLKKCVHQSLSNTTSTLVEQLLTISPSIVTVIKEIVYSTSDASLVLDLLRLLFELLRSLAQNHNDLTSLPISSESKASLPSFISKLVDTLLENSDWEMRDSGIEFLGMFLEQRQEEDKCSLLLLRFSETWGFVERILEFGRNDSDSGVKTSCLVALMQLSSNKLGWSTIMEGGRGVELGTGMETETRMEMEAEVETEASKKVNGRRQRFLSLIMDSLSDIEELVRRAALDVLSELLKNDWGLRFLFEASTGEVFKLKPSFQSLFQDEDWEVKLRAVRILFSTAGALFDPSPEIREGGEGFARGLLSLRFFLLVEGEMLVIASVKDEDRVPRLEARKRAQQLLGWCSEKEFTEEEEKEIGIEAGRRMKTLLEKLEKLDLRKLVVEATTEALYGVDDQFILDEDVDEANNQMDCY